MKKKNLIYPIMILSLATVLFSACKKDDKKDDFDRTLIFTAKIDGEPFQQYVEGELIGNSIVITRRDVKENTSAMSITLCFPEKESTNRKVLDMDYSNPSKATCYAILTDENDKQFYPYSGWIEIDTHGSSTPSVNDKTKGTYYVYGYFEFRAGEFTVTEGKFKIGYDKAL